MRIPTALCAALICLGVLASAQEGPPPTENYTLEVDGQSFSIGLDQAKTVTLKDGRSLKVKVGLKRILTHRGRLVSFSYLRGSTPTSRDLDRGISQTILMSPTGGGVILQEYTGTDPSGVLPIVARNLVEDEVAGGWKLTREEATRTVDGLVLKGFKLVTTSPKGDEEWIRYALAGSRKGEGILVVTQLDRDEDAKIEQAIIDRFWETLSLRF